MAKFAINASGAMLLPSLVQVSESISGSVVPLAMFQMMKAILLFIFTTTFSSTMTKQFLVTLDKDKGEESVENRDIIEEDKKEEEVNNAKGSHEKDLDRENEELDKEERDPAKMSKDYSVAIDYSSPKQSSPVRKRMGQDYSGGMRWRKPSRWECRFKKSKR